MKPKTTPEKKPVGQNRIFVCGIELGNKLWWPVDVLRGGGSQCVEEVLFYIFPSLYHYTISVQKQCCFIFCTISAVSCEPVSHVYTLCCKLSCEPVSGVCVMYKCTCEPVCAVIVNAATSTVPSGVLSFYVCCSSVSFFAALIKYSGNRQPKAQSL